MPFHTSSVLRLSYMILRRATERGAIAIDAMERPFQPHAHPTSANGIQQMTIHRICAAILLTVLTHSALAQNQVPDPRVGLGEFAFSEDSLQIRYLSRQLQNRPGLDIGETTFGFFLNEERDIVGSAAFLLRADRLPWERLSLYFGPAAYAALLSAEDTDVFGIGLRAEARFVLFRDAGVTVLARGTYSPDILTFGSADRFWDAIGQIEAPLTERITGFAGFRVFEIDLLDGKRELEENAYLGLRYRF